MEGEKGAGLASAWTENEAQKISISSSSESSKPPQTVKQARDRSREQAWLAARIDTLLTLRQHFPKAFARLNAYTRRPLKTRTHLDIAAAIEAQRTIQSGMRRS